MRRETLPGAPRKLLHLSLSSPLCTSKFYNGKIQSGRVARKQITWFTSQCNILSNNCPFNFINLSDVKIRRTFLSTSEKIIKKDSAFLGILFDYEKL